jgi:hypothetical protein
LEAEEMVVARVLVRFTTTRRPAAVVVLYPEQMLKGLLSIRE